MRARIKLCNVHRCPNQTYSTAITTTPLHTQVILQSHLEPQMQLCSRRQLQPKSNRSLIPSPSESPETSPSTSPSSAHVPAVAVVAAPVPILSTATATVSAEAPTQQRAHFYPHPWRYSSYSFALDPNQILTSTRADYRDSVATLDSLPTSATSKSLAPPPAPDSPSPQSQPALPPQP